MNLAQPVNAGAGDIWLGSYTAVAQQPAGVLTGDALAVGSLGTVALAAAANDVNTLAVGSAGLTEFRDADELTIGATAAATVLPLPTLAGIDSSDSDVLLQTGTSLTVNQPIDAGTAATCGSSPEQRCPSGRGRRSRPMPWDPCRRECDAVPRHQRCQRVGGHTSGVIGFHDSDDLTVGAVTASGAFLATDGITSGNSDVNLRIGTSLMLNRPLNAGTGDVRIVAGTTSARRGRRHHGR